ncbi:hypothetical protein BGW38_006589 [Lunasporangiospora selenospora]|uniref:Uncharacterized protein n=1 Tax=Lunasporangiospora selenospora TaxID=979761 RepID=A0A9P6FM08_9FUNG|nr:hypothetical protein BGW38_006589 [Lunasporangiospora selenospora]
MVSHYEKRRKGRARMDAMDWAKELEYQKLDEGAIVDELKRVENKIKDLERTIKKGRKGLTEQEADQSLTAKIHRTAVRERGKKANKDGIGGVALDDDRESKRKKTYQALKDARRKVRALRATLQPQESQLRRMRKERNYWSGLRRAVTAKTPKSKDGPKATMYTTPTVEGFTVEDSTRHLDISQLPEDRITLGEIKTHFNRYAVLSGTKVDVEKTLGCSNPEPWPPPPDQESSAKTVAKASRSRIDSGVGGATASGQQLTCKSRPFKITAPQINEASGMRRVAKRRERRLKKAENEGAREALEKLSDKEQVLKTAQTMEEIDKVRELHRESRTVLKGFERSKARLKDLHNQ